MTFNDLLGWPEYQQGAVTPNADGDLLVEAILLVTPAQCKVCRRKVPEEAQIYRQDKNERFFHDTTVNGRRKLVAIVHRRWECRTCGKTFAEDLPHIHERRKLTVRAWEYIWRVFEKREFRDIAYELGADEDLVARGFRDRLEIEDDAYYPVTPRVLGMDEIKAIRRQKMFGTITNIESGTMVEVLKDSNKEAFGEYFRQMPDRERVEIVTMDMTGYYRDLIERWFPNAVVICDKWHILAHADRTFTSLFSRYQEQIKKTHSLREAADLWEHRPLYVRRYGELQEGQQQLVDRWNRRHPHLGLCWSLKEGFHGIYTCHTGADAMEAYEAWKARITPETVLYQETVVQTIERWLPEYLNYFDHGRHTNALTEGLNAVIRNKQRQGRAYSYEVIRAVSIHRAGKRKQIRLAADSFRVPKLERGMVAESGPHYPASLYEDHGMPLSTLIEFVEHELP